MNKVNKFILRSLLYVFPLVVIWMAWWILQYYAVIPKAGRVLQQLGEVMAWVFITWMALFIVMLIELMFYEKFRNEFFAAVARFAGIKERDERESLMIDRASRHAFLSTLSFLVFILFFYSLSVSVGNIPPEKVVDGKHKTLSIGFGFEFTEKKAADKPVDPDIYFSTRDFPLSKWSLVLLIIIWHVASFYIYLRRNNKYS